jgi:hypothetical protein
MIFLRNYFRPVIQCVFLFALLESCDDYCPPTEVMVHYTHAYTEFSIEFGDGSMNPLMIIPLGDSGSIATTFVDFRESPAEIPFWVSIGACMMCHHPNSSCYNPRSHVCTTWKMIVKILNPQPGQTLSPTSPSIEELTFTETSIDPAITGDPSGETEILFESVRVEGEITFMSLPDPTELVFDLWFYDDSGDYRHVKDGWMWFEDGGKECVGT